LAFWVLDTPASSYAALQSLLFLIKITDEPGRRDKIPFYWIQIKKTSETNTCSTKAAVFFLCLETAVND